jgi:glycosyltransferase involved in cell wall biosynthesis
MVVPVSAAIHHWRCQLVYSNTLTVSVGALAAKLLRLPHIWHVHELWGGETGFEFDLGETFSLRLVNRFSDVCIANSKTVADRLASAVGREKLHVAYQSVTLKETAAPFETPVAKLDPDATAFLIVASVLPLKRQEDAIRAVALLKRRGVKAELWLAGEETGPYARQLRQLAASQNVAAEVRLLGFCRDPAALQRAADVILSCCPLEGFGRATAQAMPPSSHSAWRIWPQTPRNVHDSGRKVGAGPRPHLIPQRTATTWPRFSSGQPVTGTGSNRRFGRDRSRDRRSVRVHVCDARGVLRAGTAPPAGMAHAPPPRRRGGHDRLDRVGRSGRSHSTLAPLSAAGLVACLAARGCRARGSRDRTC